MIREGSHVCWSLEILDLASIGIILSRQRTTKVLSDCADAQADLRLLFAYGVKRFSHDVAQISAGVGVSLSYCL